MRFDSQSLTLHLKPRQIVSLPQDGRKGVSVSVQSGSVWITEDHNHADIVLEEGQSHASHKAGLMLIYGLAEADVHIEDSDTAAGRRLNA